MSASASLAVCSVLLHGEAAGSIAAVDGVMQHVILQMTASHVPAHPQIHLRTLNPKPLRTAVCHH